MDSGILKKYCDLVMSAGINLYEGQCLQISAGVEYSDFACLLAESAYAKGAKYVNIQFTISRLKKYRIEGNTNPDYLEFVPDYIISKANELLSNDWAYIRIDNLEELNELKGVDSVKYDIIKKRESEIYRKQSQAFSTSRNSWCVIAVPGPKWASRVFNTNNSDSICEKLWDVLIPILRLNKPDPVSEWKSHGERLLERSKAMTDLKFDKLIFEAPGTKLEVGLNPHSIWAGGPVKAENGRTFFPNIPTEEIYTTPDFKRTNGKVKVTKPVKVLKNLLTGIWFEFKEGKVINFGSDSNREILEKFLNTDEGASYAGEIALVDIQSEVYKSGLIFNSALYDENAASHIALGRGIQFCFPNKENLDTPEDMKKNGCNYSQVHTDFMIGSPEMTVKGVTYGGEEIQIIENGKFNI